MLPTSGAVSMVAYADLERLIVSFSVINLSVSEGGMITTSNDTSYNKLRKLRSHGMTSLTLDRHKGVPFYDVTKPGLNYHVDEIRAALGIVQLTKLLDANIKRRVLTDRYAKNLHGSLISTPFMMYPKGNSLSYISCLYFQWIGIVNMLSSI